MATYSEILYNQEQYAEGLSLVVTIRPLAEVDVTAPQTWVMSVSVDYVDDEFGITTVEAD